MENFINNVKNVVSLDVLIYIVIALVAIVILTIIMMVLRQKQARKQLDELELSYNSLKGIPLAFKLNKAVALSRVNEEMSQRVESCRTDFDNIQEQLKECSVTLAEADDLIYVHKAKAAKRRMEKLREQMAELEGVAKDVNQALDSILEQENEQRVHINKLKDDFRIIKRNINENRASFSQSYEYLEMEIAAIEKMFSAFEEWMFASEFNKAADQQKEIRESVAHLKELVDVLPSMYERARGVLPRAIDEVGYQYAQAKNKGVYTEHLEVRKNLDIISDMLKNNETKKDVSKKDKDTFNTLELALEMNLRGYYFTNIDIMRSASREFIVDPENANYIIPPFTSIDGLGENVADTVVEARRQGAFLSKEDLQRRTALSGTLVKKMESMGVLEGMQDENQMSLFSF